MKKIVRLTENDLMKIVKRVIKENEDMGESETFKNFLSDIDNIFTNIKTMEDSSGLEYLYMDLSYIENEIINNMDKLSDKEYDMLMHDINVCKKNIEYMSDDFEDGEEEDDDITSYNTKWIMPSDDNK